MSNANMSDMVPHPDGSDCKATSLADWLHEVSCRIDPDDCDDLTELGLYSIHDGSARTITLPKEAERFQEATNVKQYYYQGGECPLLIIVAITI